MSASLSVKPAARGGALQAPRSRVAAAARRLSVVVRADSCLIVNTKGGGHAFLGLHLARKLLAAGHEVTILNDGDHVGAGLGCWLRLPRPALPAAAATMHSARGPQPTPHAPLASLHCSAAASHAD